LSRLRSCLGVLCIIAVCLMFISYGCTPPPTQEIADAEAALAAAKAAGAEIYAAQEYQSAESKLEEARKANEASNYLGARNMAIEAKDQAMLAKSLAEEAIIGLREQAKAGLETAKEALSAAEMAGAKKHDPNGYRSVEALYGEADTAYIGEDYQTALQKAEEVTKRARRLELAAKRAAELEKPEEPVVEVPQMPEPESLYDNHMVQKGECLWIISGYERIYANPFQWPLIYRANRSQIDDPDLIFPGQNFMIPRNPDPKEVDDAINTAKNRGPWSLFDGR